MSGKYLRTVDPAQSVFPTPHDMEAGLRATARMLHECNQHVAARDYELLADAVSSGLIASLRQEALTATVVSGRTRTRRGVV